ncbi:MAG: hypothetical protein NC089_03875 [Bacteroides sp.]|nr:hypothetical protein [Bacteroides sp.]MCM1549695.1 hypothetical protein [Clostridium sp.]
MDFKELMHLTDGADTLNGIMLYVLAGIGALLAILLIVWLLFKLSALISRKKNHTIQKDEPTDEEQLFGD